MPDQPPVLTYALRGLVWGIESEVAVLGNLARLIDEHVGALNALRAELAERLLRLDALRGEADDAQLTAFLDTAAAPQLPVLDEQFPERLYGG